MKKLNFAFALACAAALASLTGCGTTSRGMTTNAPPPYAPAYEAQQAAPAAARPPQPIIGAEGVPQPDWVRNPGKMETVDMVYFVGEGRLGSTTTARKNSAVADAGRQVGDWKESSIKSAIKDYVQEAGVTGHTQSLEHLEVSSIQRARANTSGISQRETWIAPDSTYVVLVSYPKSDLKRDFQNSLNTFVRDEGAQFAEFKAQEAYKYLEREVDPSN